MKRILLDIDGVISPLYSLDEDFYSVDIEWTKFSIPKNIASFIKGLSERCYVIWASSWEGDSIKVSKYLSFNIEDYLTFQSKSESWFKISCIREYCLSNENDEILLIDDEANEFLEFFSDLKNLTIISPDDRIGLSHENMMEIKNWLTK